MSSLERTPRALRLAVATWARRDRRASGDVVIGTAMDLIEAGSSPRREALCLVRAGVGMRARGMGRDFVAAPWRNASRLSVIWTCLLVAAIVVATHGGWRALLPQQGEWSTYTELGSVTGEPSGPRVLWDIATAVEVATLLLTALSAWLRRPALAAAGLVAVGGMLFAVKWVGPGLDMVQFGLGPSHLLFGSDLDGLVGLMLAVALLGAVADAITRRGALRRGSPTGSVVPGTTVMPATPDTVSNPRAASAPSAASGDAHPSRPETPRGRSRAALPWLGAVAWLALAPAAGALIDDALNGTSPGITFDLVPTPTGAVILVLFAMLAAPTAAVGMRRRRPAAALAATLIGIGLIVPVAWNVPQLVAEVTWKLGITLMPRTVGGLYAEWFVFGLLCLVIAARIAAATGAAARQRSSAAPRNDGFPGEPAIG